MWLIYLSDGFMIVAWSSVFKLARQSPLYLVISCNYYSPTGYPVNILLFEKLALHPHEAAHANLSRGLNYQTEICIDKYLQLKFELDFVSGQLVFNSWTIIFASCLNFQTLPAGRYLLSYKNPPMTCLLSDFFVNYSCGSSKKQCLLNYRIQNIKVCSTP